jgi:hypothetical protein
MTSAAGNLQRLLVNKISQGQGKAGCECKTFIKSSHQGTKKQSMVKLNQEISSLESFI